MQNTGPVGCAGHSRIAQPQHVAMALFQQRLGHRYHAPFGHAGTTLRAGIPEDQHMVSCHRIIFIIDDILLRVIAVSNDGRTGMPLEFLIHRRRLDNRAIRCQITLQNGQ